MAGDAKALGGIELRIARTLRSEPGLSGAGLGRRSGVGTHVLYPALMGMERDGLVASAWERPDPGLVPRRRLYALTPEGHARVAAEPPAARGAPATWRGRAAAWLSRLLRRQADAPV